MKDRIQSYLTIHVAWTFDDGPTAATAPMRAAFIKEATAEKGAPPANATWYVMRNLLPTPGDIKRLAALQLAGDEIAIHSMHKTKDHVAWFPVPCIPGGDFYPNVADAVADLTAFHDELFDAGLKIKFVRIPYGLHTEITRYLEKEKVPNADAVARVIIKGGAGPATAKKVADDFKTVFDAVKALPTTSGGKTHNVNLHEWGGASTDTLSFNSWEAEASGVSSRTDDVTLHVSAARAAAKGGSGDKPGQFERLVARTARDKRPHTLVVLAHDKVKADVDEVAEDIRAMLAAAKAKGVAVKLVTMSELFKIATKSPP